MLEDIIYKWYVYSDDNKIPTTWYEEDGIQEAMKHYESLFKKNSDVYVAFGITDGNGSIDIISQKKNQSKLINIMTNDIYKTEVGEYFIEIWMGNFLYKYNVELDPIQKFVQEVDFIPSDTEILFHDIDIDKDPLDFDNIELLIAFPKTKVIYFNEENELYYFIHDKCISIKHYQIDGSNKIEVIMYMTGGAYRMAYDEVIHHFQREKYNHKASFILNTSDILDFMNDGNISISSDTENCTPFEYENVETHSFRLNLEEYENIDPESDDFDNDERLYDSVEDYVYALENKLNDYGYEIDFAEYYTVFSVYPKWR